jgi:Pyruvate/2-oxoacid:ferredoxin oxidoreductase delta subunit
MTTIVTVIAVVFALVLVAFLALWIFGERGHLMLPSTRAAMRPRKSKAPRAPRQHGGTPSQYKLKFFDVIHAYVYGRWTNQYISTLINWVMPRLNAHQREEWANHYHGKVLTPELAAEMITLDHDIDARNQEHIVPYPMARDIVLKSPVNITLYECACRHARANGCGPTDVCMTFGGISADFQLDHNPQSARRITQKEALDILRAEHERGHLHSAWFKDILGDRMFAICNCCKCCCGGIEAMTKYGSKTMVSSGYVAAIDEGNCTVCGTCVDACPFDALSMKTGMTTVNQEKCMGCGVCEGQCQFEAIALVRDESKPAPLDVRVLA